MREELKEIREGLANIRDREWVENALDPQWAAGVANGLLAALDRLEAQMAEAEKDAKELAWAIHDSDAVIGNFDVGLAIPIIASALAAQSRKVPMAMLMEICDYGLGSDKHCEISRKIKLSEIAESYHVQVKG